jgi:hypothetical protein
VSPAAAAEAVSGLPDLTANMVEPIGSVSPLVLLDERKASVSFKI